MDIGTLLKEARKRKGYTLKELEAVTGIGKSAIQRYERGQAMPIAKAIRLFDALDISLDITVKPGANNG